MATIGSTDLSKLDPSLTQIPQKEARKKDEIGQNEFMTLLVAQLKAQDPMDPMKNEDFAVNLAQFSQLENLVAIKETLKGGDNSIASLSGYLGQQVLLNSNEVVAHEGDAGQLLINLSGNAANVEVNLLNAEGGVVDTINYGAVEAGEHTLQLNGLSAANGAYGVSVSASSSTGSSVGVTSNVSGLVTGFIPGDQPTLLLGNREIDPALIKEVHLA